MLYRYICSVYAVASIKCTPFFWLHRRDLILRGHMHSWPPPAAACHGNDPSCQVGDKNGRQAA